MPNDLGQRMKENYERPCRHYFTRRTPVVVRVDGRAFHTFTQDFKRPFDDLLMDAMTVAALQVFEDIQGCKLAYIQSDEASFVMTDDDTLQTQGWFNYNQSKIETATASRMTMAFNRCMRLCKKLGDATFDSRAFNIPESEVANYFLWRAKDWERNSLQMYAGAHFSHGEMQGKGTQDLHEMLHGIGKNWTHLWDVEKNGTFLARLGGEIVVSTTIPSRYDAIAKLWDDTRLDKQ